MTDRYSFSPLPSAYDPKLREKYWQEQWLASGVYAYKDDLPRESTFVIDTPPPTVSGLLHMGHIFSYTQADLIARYQRMSGKDVFYPMGFDDNGLPTERLVEKVKGVRANALAAEEGGREKFIALCKDVVEEAENEFRTLFKSVALSVDWKLEYQTVSPRVRALSQQSFIELLQKGEAYRDFRPTYWDWVDQTAIAQAEIENKDMPGVMHELRFGLVGENPLSLRERDGVTQHITIATTRPELLGACVAVMYHPEDENAAVYKGKYAVTPLFGVKVPMIADELVEQDKGTGLVMCCTFGDDTDKEWWRKHGLPMRPIIGTNGKITFSESLVDQNPREISFTQNGGKDGVRGTSYLNSNNCVDISKAYNSFREILNFKPKQAQAKIVELLEAEGALLKKAPIQHAVKCAERSGTPIEIIPTHQWFVRIADKKEELLAKGDSCTWYPDYMQIRLNQWIEGLKEDWCISRQRFFGVPFPVWYSKREGEEGKILLPEISQLPVDPLTDLPNGYTRDEVIADKDVMDTWATSSLTPEINAQSLAPNKLFPADLRPQAHEIIRSWAFYTIAKAHLHGDCKPWENVMISGWCLASDKTKMSKSKGNVVTPVALIEDKGADAVRYWASTSRLGADTAFSEDLLKIGRKLVNKLWNASNFVSQQLVRLQTTPQRAVTEVESGVITETLDRWILSRLHRAVARASQEFERFEYADARSVIEDFFWNDFCDNYLELVKVRAYGEEGKITPAQTSALYTLYHCLHAILHLFAPFVPHVTEEIYSHLFAGSGSVHARGSWPKAEAYPFDKHSEEAGMAAVEILNAIRKVKSEASVSIKYPVQSAIVTRVQEIAPQVDGLEGIIADVSAAGNAGFIGFAEHTGEESVTSANGWFSVHVTLAPQEKSA